jgi:hypothetical protein
MHRCFSSTFRIAPNDRSSSKRRFRGRQGRKEVLLTLRSVPACLSASPSSSLS